MSTTIPGFFFLIFMRETERQRRRLEISLGCGSSVIAHRVFWDRAYPWNLGWGECLIRLADWQATEPWRSTRIHLPSSGVIGMHHHTGLFCFSIDSVDRTQIQMFTRQACWLRYLPGPTVLKSLEMPPAFQLLMLPSVQNINDYFSHPDTPASSRLVNTTTQLLKTHVL